jgi:hypothetical protein
MNPRDTSATTSATDERPGQQSPRKVYQKPELQVYGDLTAITQGLNALNSNDGSGHPNKHFTS